MKDAELRQAGMRDGTHIMVDLETLGTGPDAAIIEIGATVFDCTGAQDLDTYSWGVDIRADEEAGNDIGSMTADTVLWHLERDTLKNTDTGSFVPLQEALTSLVGVAQDNGVDWWWFKGLDFDVPILKSAMRRCRMGMVADSVLHRHRLRCVRSIVAAAELLGMPTWEWKHQHVAGYDAKDQARAVFASFVALGIWDGEGS